MEKWIINLKLLQVKERMKFEIKEKRKKRGTKSLRHTLTINLYTCDDSNHLIIMIYFHSIGRFLVFSSLKDAVYTHTHT